MHDKKYALSVLIPNSFVFGLIYSIDLNKLLQTILLLLSIAFTLWQWRRAAKQPTENPKMKKPFRFLQLFILLSMLAMLCGCSFLIPTEHKEQVAVKSAGELSATHEENLTKRSASPSLALKLGGIGNKIDLQLPPQGETHIESSERIQSSGDDSAKGSSASSIPLFVKVIGCAIGLLLLGGVVFWGIKAIRNGAAGTAAAAAFNLADKEISNAISSVEMQLQTTDNPQVKQTALAHLTSLEKSRGKLAANAPPRK